MSDAHGDEEPRWRQQGAAAVAAARESPEAGWAVLAAQEPVRPHSRPCAIGTVEDAGEGAWRAVLREITAHGGTVELGSELARGALEATEEDAERTAAGLHAGWWNDWDGRTLVLVAGDELEAWWREGATEAKEVEAEVRKAVSKVDGDGFAQRLFVAYEADGETGAEIVVGHNAAGPMGPRVIERFKASRACRLDGEEVGWWLPAHDVLVRGALEAYKVWKDQMHGRATETALLVQRSVQARVESEPAALAWLAGGDDTAAADHLAVTGLLGADVAESDQRGPFDDESELAQLVWTAATAESKLREPYRCRVVVSELGEAPQRSVRVEFSTASGYVAQARALRWKPTRIQHPERRAAPAETAVVWWAKALEDAQRARRHAKVVQAPEPEAELGLGL